MRRFTTSLLMLACAVALRAQQPICYPLFFWNVENYFDVQDDSLTLDEEYTPQGARHWTPKRYAAKRTELFKTIVQMGEAATAMQDWCADPVPPAVVGLSEVENDGVLRDLCLGTPLRSLGYSFVHFDSPDRRGVDCALLYRKEMLRLLQAQAIHVSDSAADFLTRDILRADLVTRRGGDTLILFVLHLPSKLGGAVAEQRRLCLAQRLMDSLAAAQRQHPSAHVVAMGDFNGEADELGVGHALAQTGQFRNLSLERPLSVVGGSATPQQVKGSYNYQGRWSTIDQIILSSHTPTTPMSLLAPDRLLRYDPRTMTYKLNRTFLGPRYLGGVSDHLPVGVVLTLGE